MTRVLITGCAGFIGSHLTDRLLSLGHEVVGIDNFNDYYDPNIKEMNLNLAKKSNRILLQRVDILDIESLKKIFVKEKPEYVMHLAARAGVRPSIENPLIYVEVNVLGTVNLLKLSVEYKVKKFIFASSSSVYGNSKKIPFKENDLCQNIISPYAASKRSAELFVETFHKSYGLKSIILRLFTVYGQRGRVDMAPALFSKAILNNETLLQFGDGKSSRDYTFIDDIIDGLEKALNSNLDYGVFNLGNNNPVTLEDFIKTIEKVANRKAKILKRPRAQGDVGKTWAEIENARKLLKWKPHTKLAIGLAKYIKWYTSCYSPALEH